MTPPLDPVPLLLSIVGPPAVGQMTVGAYVRASDDPREAAAVERYAAPFREREGERSI